MLTDGWTSSIHKPELLCNLTKYFTYTLLHSHGIERGNVYGFKLHYMQVYVYTRFNCPVIQISVLNVMLCCFIKLKYKVLKYYVEVKLWRHKIPTNCVSVILRHILGPDSLKTFPGTCKRNFLCLHLISFEFLRAVSIGWTVSRGQHFIHMTRPGQQLVSHDLFLILWRLLRYDKSTSSTELNYYSILFFRWHLSYLCADSMDTYTYNQC